jgi:hypothetical protein
LLKARLAGLLSFPALSEARRQPLGMLRGLRGFFYDTTV